MSNSPWDEIEEQARSLKPLRTYLIGVKAQLSTISEEHADTARTLYLAYRAIRHWANRSLIGLCYVHSVTLEFEHGFEDFESFPVHKEPLDDLRCRIAAGLSFNIVAKDKALALARFRSTVNWIREIAPVQDLFRDIDLNDMEQSAETTHLQEIEIAPWSQAVNYPNAAYWSTANESSEIPASAFAQFVVFREAELHEIRTDTVQEAVAALEALNLLLQRVFTDVTQWKWILQTLHSGLQNFMVASLQGTSPVRVLKPLTKQEERKAAKGQHIERRLKSFLELYDCIKDDQMMGQYTTSRCFSPNSSQDMHVRQLNELRNEFVHFTPKSYIVDVWNFPALTLDVVDVIRFLALESENVPWHYDVYPKIRTKELLQLITDHIERISDQYLGSVQDVNKYL